MAGPNLANVERFSGFADDYDRYRPSPPAALLDLIRRVAGVPRPRLVVDIGCGTGLSTVVWADCAAAVVGIEPSPDMRRVAQQRAATASASVRIMPGHSAAIDLPDESAEIVTAAQSLHWMEPAPTFAEVARILRSGGVFAAYDYEAPPLVHWRIDQAHDAVMRRVADLAPQRGSERGVHQWDKSGHPGRIAASGCFRWSRQVMVHHRTRVDAAHLIGGMRTYGGLVALLKSGATVGDVGLDAYDRTVKEVLGKGSADCHWSYRVCLAVR
jgi:ubiquinone/menaquinone biosynthesis C-methylase UbiE